MPRSIGMWLAPLALLAAGCMGDDDRGATESGSRMAERIAMTDLIPVRQIALAESDSVINVQPRVSLDDSGAFIVADSRESRVRIYESTGELRRQLGRRGTAPGELQFPVHARRTKSGDLLVTDFARGLLVLDEETGAELYHARPSLRPTYQAAELSDSVWVLAGLGDPIDGRATLLHLWDPRRNAITRSFFPMPGNDATRAAASSYGSVSIDIDQDGILAVFAMSDTAYRFDFEGNVVQRVWIPVPGFEPVTEFDQGENPLEAVSWLEQHRLLESIHAMSAGMIAVQYAQAAGRDNRFGSIVVSANGELLLAEEDAPRLLAAEDDLLFYVDSAHAAPNRWLVMQWPD